MTKKNFEEKNAPKSTVPRVVKGSSLATIRSKVFKIKVYISIAISLLDVYQAVDCLGKTGQLFSFHDNPNPNCPVGAHIHEVLDQKLERIQLAMEAELGQTSLEQVVADAESQMKE